MVFDVLQFAIILFLAGGTALGAGALITGGLISPRAVGGDIGLTYECGMRPLGSAWQSFGISYYMYAMLFIAFDVDVLYLFPVSAYYTVSVGWAAFVKLFIFLFFLLLALVYFHAKGVFTWSRKIKV